MPNLMTVSPVKVDAVMCLHAYICEKTKRKQAFNIFCNHSYSNNSKLED